MPQKPLKVLCVCLEDTTWPPIFARLLQAAFHDCDVEASVESAGVISARDVPFITGEDLSPMAKGILERFEYGETGHKSRNVADLFGQQFDKVICISTQADLRIRQMNPAWVPNILCLGKVREFDFPLPEDEITCISFASHLSRIAKTLAGQLQT